MTTDKCPGCGVGIREIEGIGTDWETVIYTCGTGEDSGYFSRECWANQCAAMRQLVREMGKILQATLPLTISASDWALKYGIHSLNIMERPKVRAIMAEGEK